ncbi:MAG TPA: DUF1440 domain-containing protein [Blastocatellia bacterium]|nr:DUF1440 domain-containing protein [Blastocatellia bacterium]
MTGSNIMTGALAGFAATVPMTVAMEVMHKQLPPDEQYPLPPAEITSELASEARVSDKMDEKGITLATLASHFAYGAAAGALYAPLASRLRPNPLLGGAAYGLAVWSASYLGLLPGLGILKPATEHPARRNALMIASHVIWGTALGMLVSRMSDD